LPGLAAGFGRCSLCRAILEADGELTERELDVLHLLTSELPTRQLAQSLYVAPSTVRARVKSIYRKLGVSSRKEALEEAGTRELI
jgi:DNA-binding NarL/FixJ family response regulator